MLVSSGRRFHIAELKSEDYQHSMTVYFLLSAFSQKAGPGSTDAHQSSLSDKKVTES